jgi:hypothetical protein
LSNTLPATGADPRVADTAAMMSGWRATWEACC